MRHRTDQPTRPTVIGVLLTNLGTPDSYQTKDVRRFLKEFLSDPRVVEAPRVLWWLLLNLFILPTRPRRSAKAYKKIWQDGSPLLRISERQAAGLQQHLQQHRQIQAAGAAETVIEVVLAMRYGQPAIATALNQLHQRGARRILLLPLYPQFSATTTASTFDAVGRVFATWRWLPELRTIHHYHDDADYIKALKHSVEACWRAHGRADKLVMSFHGIPQSYFAAGDPYYCECHKTARLLAEALGLAATEWVLTFQSRFGPKKWLQPYTDVTLCQLAAQRQSVQVICPGFSADCLETLEEIAIQNRETFIAAGGQSYRYIPCLNDSAEHIHVLANIVMRHLGGWLGEGSG